MSKLSWYMVVIVVITWLEGLAVRPEYSLIHLVLVVIAIVQIYNLDTGKEV